MNPFATRDAKWHFASEASDDPSRREMILRFRSQRRPLATRNDTSLPKYLSATNPVATRNNTSLPKYLFQRRTRRDAQREMIRFRGQRRPSQREMIRFRGQRRPSQREMIRFRSIFQRRTLRNAK